MFQNASKNPQLMDINFFFKSTVYGYQQGLSKFMTYDLKSLICGFEKTFKNAAKNLEEAFKNPRKEIPDLWPLRILENKKINQR